MNGLLELLEQAVERVLDKNPKRVIAVCLSGGLDSSTIASLASELPVVTGWYDHPGCDEREYAALCATDRDWIQVKITPFDFVNCFDSAAKAVRGLNCGPGAVGQYVVARKLADCGFDLVLTGEGGDELFGGYARQYKVAGLELPGGYEDWQQPEDYPGTLRGALDLEWRNLRELTRVDERIAGVFGIEVIPPMLDPWVVAYVHQFPSQVRIGKTWLKEAVRGLVPDPIIDRRDKKGFPVPFVAWAQEDPVRSFVQDRIGYIPDPDKPWDRQWWNDMRDAAAGVVWLRPRAA